MQGSLDEKTLGKRLQLARKRAGLTQQELCQKAGLSYSTLAKIERGAIRSPSVFTVAAIAGATNTQLEDLLNIPGQSMSSPAPANVKKRSKTGITFVYLDINGTLIRFFHKAFVEIARKAGVSTDVVETIFWRHHDSLATGQTSWQDFDNVMGKELNLEGFSWHEYYIANTETMPSIVELVNWIAGNYEIGIFSNSFPGIIDELRQQNIVPNVPYKVIVDSSKTGLVKPELKFYELAQQLASVEPREILLIDNERPNLTSADRSGWHTVWFDETQPEESINRAKQALEF
jgi:FMN phosphatase YigB (HAD superfamily)/DNA-binding XRE family transcriptional regulator